MIPRIRDRNFNVIIRSSCINRCNNFQKMADPIVFNGQTIGRIILEITRR
nr:hypothetical protein [Geminocystis sp. GBBB08]